MQLTLMSKSIEARERLLVQVREILARDFPDLRSKAERLFNGPPVGWPAQIRVTGPDRNEVRRLSAHIAEVMRANPNVGSVHNDWFEPVPNLKLEIDQDRARALGFTSQSVRRALQAMLSGFQIGEFREQDETIKVMLREPSNTRNLLSALDVVYVKTTHGASVPLRQVANVQMMLEPGIQWRRDRLPSITVRGVVADDVQSSDVTKAIFDQLKPLRDGLLADYRIEMQGAVEESATSEASINEKMPVMLLVILLLLMIQLQHLGKTFVVLATGPLGLIGAATALLVFQAPFGFVAILGVIALAGIIMRNSVILVDQIQQDLATGHDRRVGGSPIPADQADRRGRRAGPDPACSRGFLGADGFGDDGRRDRRNSTDADVSACALRARIQGCGPKGPRGADRRQAGYDAGRRGGRAGCRISACRARRTKKPRLVEWRRCEMLAHAKTSFHRRPHKAAAAVRRANPGAVCRNRAPVNLARSERCCAGSRECG